MYLIHGMRPNITLAVRQLSKHNVDSRKSHLQEAKKVVQYFHRVMELGLIHGQELNSWMHRDPTPYGLLGFADSNFARDSEDWKLVIRYCFFFTGAIVFWSNKKQRTISKSPIENKYIALGHVFKEAVWIRKFINKMNVKIVEIVTIQGNNEMSIVLTKNSESQYWTKYIDV